MGNHVEDLNKYAVRIKEGQRVLGSGVLWKPKSCEQNHIYVFTAAHVIKNHENVEVEFWHHENVVKLSVEKNMIAISKTYVKVLNDEEDGVVPELFFSSAQLNAVALSVFLGGALSSYNSKVKTIFIDDPIGHFDDLNVLSFIDVIRTIISETDWQIIISTHEENFYEIMKVKLNPQYYNSKFLVFKDEGIVVEDEVM